jgi:cytochrome c-type biogenesis protein CcmH/NrfG
VPTPMQKLAASQQDPSVSGMVGRLVERLKKDRTDLNGWLMLVRSYKVMNEPDKAKAAVAEAKQALGNDPEKNKQLDAALTADVNAPPPASPPPQQNAQGAGAATTGQHAGETIDVMVEHLHEKLQKSGDNPDGWLMLIRSYLTMKENAKATAAVKEARKALASDPQKLQAFDAALKHYKIDAPQ